jgi:hypothetical protein
MADSVEALLLDSFRYRFRGVKKLGDRTLAQLSGEDLVWRPNAESNSAAVIVQHMHGNMMSRWTDFVTADGDKPWRNRDGEFTESDAASREALLGLWEEGWACTLAALDALTAEDLTKHITVRGEPLDVIDAVLRQLSHYSLHVGQLIAIAKERLGTNWETLSIPRGASKAYTPGKRD